MEVKIYEGTFKTKDTSELEPIIMEIGEIEPSVKQAEFKEIKLKNETIIQKKEMLSLLRLFVGIAMIASSTSSNTSVITNT